MNNTYQDMFEKMSDIYIREEFILKFTDLPKDTSPQELHRLMIELNKELICKWAEQIQKSFIQIHKAVLLKGMTGLPKNKVS